MHKIMSKKFYLGPKFGTLFNKKWITISELLHMGLVNHPRTPKLWAIAHENVPKMQKRQVFGHATQTCTQSHGPCKSPQNPKTIGNSS
jgi:hypothetical protein